MLRSPLFYPLNRGDSEGGGAADLQTDIMRFMAILSLCLVAIFALVQSIPLNPPAPKPEQTAAVREPVPQPTSAQSATPIPTPIPTRGERPAPTKPATAKPTPAATTTPAATRTDEPVDVTEAPAPAPSVDAGFSLRFASDAALTQLVASNEVGLYAMNATGAVRMSSSGGKYAFWPASMPNRYHEMDTRTVPAAVKNALRRFGSIGRDPQLKWGVTLPTQMQGQLDRILADHDRGALIIGADGRLRREQ